MTAPKLVLYNSDACPYAARAVIALDETKQEHEVIPIDLKVPRPEWYLKDINPYGQVPALKIDDKDIILESLFVAEYVADLHPEAGYATVRLLHCLNKVSFLSSQVERTGC